MNKTLINVALAVAFGSATMSAQSATLGYGDNMSITAGIGVYVQQPSYDANGNQIGTGYVQTNVIMSWFGIDTNGDGKLSGGEKAALQQGTTGIVIGSVTTAGASHAGAPNGGDSNSITAPWVYFNNTGSDFVVTGITGSTGANGIDMSGWRVAWNGIPSINLGGGAWTGNANGKGTMTWTGVYGDTYNLDYSASVPVDDPSGFGGIKYQLHLEGVVAQCTANCIAPSAVPAPAATWLLGSGLLGLIGMARRKAVS